MGIKIHKKQKRNISYKKQIQCNNSCCNTLYQEPIRAPDCTHHRKTSRSVVQRYERGESEMRRLYSFTGSMISFSAVNPLLSSPSQLCPPSSVISLPFKGKKVYTPPPPLASPKYSSLINDVLLSRNNNNGNFICVFEWTIVNLATYR